MNAKVNEEFNDLKKKKKKEKNDVYHVEFSCFGSIYIVIYMKEIMKMKVFSNDSLPIFN